MLANLILLLAMALLGADAQAKLNGTYVAVRGEANGQPCPEDDVKNTSVVITDKDIMVYNSRTGEMEVFTYQRTSDSQDRGIDMRVVVGKDEGKISHGIYEMNGERLRISFFPAGREQRPTTFDTKGNVDQMTFEMVRVSN